MKSACRFNFFLYVFIADVANYPHNLLPNQLSLLDPLLCENNFASLGEDGQIEFDSWDMHGMIARSQISSFGNCARSIFDLHIWFCFYLTIYFCYKCPKWKAMHIKDEFMYVKTDILLFCLQSELVTYSKLCYLDMLLSNCIVLTSSGLL